MAKKHVSLSEILYPVVLIFLGTNIVHMIHLIPIFETDMSRH